MELPLSKTKRGRHRTAGVDQFAHFQVYRKRDGSLSVLGQGAMGITYRARDIQLDRDVALKVISPHLVGDDRARNRFLRESKAAAALQHPHVASILFQGEEGKTCFYAMELIHGETLENYITRTGPLSPGSALDLTRQIVGGLDAAHQRGLVHGDLTPGNLMLTSYERAGDLHLKIIDFGLSRLVQENKPLTQNAEGIFGTPGYASPEHWANGLPDCRSDIYSVGAILWLMVQGSPAFEGHPHSIVLRQAGAPPPFELLKNQPWSVRNLVQDLMQIKPEDRPKDPARVLDRIAQARLDLPEEDAPPRKLHRPTQVLPGLHEDPPEEGSGSRFGPWLKLTGMLAALALMVLWFVLSMETRESKEIEEATLSPIHSPSLPGSQESAAGFSMAGKWASTSGSMVVIPNDPNEFIMVVTHPDGEVSRLKAYWIKGREGKQFTFVNEYGRVVVSTIDPQNHNRVKLIVEDRVYYWQRV